MLCKIQAYNITVLNAQMYESGIEPDFQHRQKVYKPDLDVQKMMAAADVREGCLQFAVYTVLKIFDPKKEGYMSQTRFYKVMYILDKKLLKRKIDIKLPWYWYIYGPALYLEGIDKTCYEISRISEDEGARVYYGDLGSIPEPATARAIKTEITRFHATYPKTRDLITQVYKDPPKKILCVFKEFDDFAKSIADGQGTLFAKEELTIKHLDAIYTSFSDDDFKEIVDDYLRFDDIMRLIILHKPEILNSVSPLIHEFRKVLATKASAIYYKNMPDDWPKIRMALFNKRLHDFQIKYSEFESDVYRYKGIKNPAYREHSMKLMQIAHDIAKEV